MDPEPMQFSLADIDRAIELFGFIRQRTKDDGAVKAEQLLGLEG